MRLEDVDWDAMNVALRAIGTARTEGEVGEVAVAACRHALRAVGADAWVVRGDGAAATLLTTGPAAARSERPARRSVRDLGAAVGCADGDDGSRTCRVGAVIDEARHEMLAVDAMFDPDDHLGPLRRQALRALTTAAAAAIARTRIGDNDRHIALVLQQHLLPRLDPRSSGQVAARYVPAGAGADVGGDWYDLVHTRDGRTVVVLGDVAGHSIESAVQMAEIRTALRSHLIEGLPASLALARLNDLLLDQGWFATCCCVEIMGTAAVVTSAGHLPPLRVDGNGGAWRCPITVGPPLGGMPGASYPGRRCELGPGDALVVYSDGLIERPGTDIDESMDRLVRAAANAHAPDLDELVDHLIGLAEPLVDLRDDIAVLAFRPDGHPPCLATDQRARVPTGDIPLDPELVWRLVDAVPDALVVVATSGAIVLANAQTEDLFGYTRSELIGQPVEILLPVGHAERHAHLRAHFVRTPSVRAMGEDGPFAARHADGTRIDVDVSLSTVPIGDEAFVMATVRRAAVRLHHPT